MAPHKRNHFLEIEDSDNEDDYHSEVELQKGARSVKRRRVIPRNDSDDAKLETIHAPGDDVSEIDSDVEGQDGGGGKGEEEEEEEEEEIGVKTKEPSKSEIFSSQDKDEIKSKANKAKNKQNRCLSGRPVPGIKRNLVSTDSAVRKSGVIYLSRIPPFMKPHKLRSLLSPYGAINRILMTPEDQRAHSHRVRNGGNKKRTFIDGWVEFVSKKDAKRAVELLNAHTIGGKKGSFYCDDVWSLLYLKGFKWHHLTDQMEAEAAEHATRMREEISRTRRENKEFVRNVERAKILETKESKKVARKSRVGRSEEGATSLS